jgi:hypothetical protein
MKNIKMDKKLEKKFKNIDRNINTKEEKAFEDFKYLLAKEITEEKGIKTKILSLEKYSNQHKNENLYKIKVIHKEEIITLYIKGVD